MLRTIEPPEAPGYRSTHADPPSVLPGASASNVTGPNVSGGEKRGAIVGDGEAGRHTDAGGVGAASASVSVGSGTDPSVQNGVPAGETARRPGSSPPRSADTSRIDSSDAAAATPATISSGPQRVTMPRSPDGSSE